MGVIIKAVRLGIVGTIVAILILFLGSLGFADIPPDSQHSKTKQVQKVYKKVLA